MGKRDKITVKGMYIFYVLTMLIFCIALAELTSLNSSDKRRIPQKSNVMGAENINCSEVDACSSCNVTILCIGSASTNESSFVYVRVKNQNTLRGNCHLQISHAGIEKRYDLGSIDAGQVKGFKITDAFPRGDLGFSMLPSCDWD
jgi:hypothetical protein